MNSTIGIIAAKEVRDIIKSKIFLGILILLFAMTLVTVILGSAQVSHQLDLYQKSVEFLKSIGKTELPPMPSLNPIAVSKNYVNYIGMLGALLAIILGHFALSKERRSKTLNLILSRPVYRDQLLTGKIIGSVLVLSAIVLIIGLFTTMFISVLGGVSLSASELTKMWLFFLMSLLYLLVFFFVEFWLSIKMPKGNNALLIGIILWLAFAFIIPQVGDTMDLDNQLPGGFFAQMGMGKVQEKAVLAKFTWYEKVRDGIEEMSPTKHFERVSFALLGIKPEFITNTPVEILKLKWLNLAGLLTPIFIFMMLSYSAFLKKE